MVQLQPSDHLNRIEKLVETTLRSNPFYQRKLASSSASFDQIPFTTKAELVEDQNRYPPYGSNLSRPLSCYTRLHQTSGTTTGKPLKWLDTQETWDWCLSCWQQVYELAGVTAQDRIFFAFSFGPFIGFWSAFESASRLGCLVLSGGGMSSPARLRFMLDQEASVLCCTPTYALHLSEVASQENMPIANSAIKKIIVAGEPGGNVQAIRQLLESRWQARVIDHYGLTEVGPVAVEPLANSGELRVLTNEYMAEILDPETLSPVSVEETGELILTNLGRSAMPAIRYRTGDLVRNGGFDEEGRLRLPGGILGRIDDMIHLRGNNIYPGAIEAIVREFPDIPEFRLILDERDSLAELRLELEQPDDRDQTYLLEAIRDRIRERLLLRIDVSFVPTGSLPRFEHKAKRLVRLK
jgi:phenylacetate-CoA ligase